MANGEWRMANGCPSLFATRHFATRAHPPPQRERRTAMSMIDRSLDGMAFVSGQLGAMLRRRLREVGGIALLSLAMMAALALATWSVQDPSLSHATDAPVRNLLGHPGAIIADLLMQLLGLGALVLLLPIAIWGYRLLGHRPLSRERLRMLLWLFGAVLAAAFASCLPRSAHWPLPCGLGGVIGDASLRLPTVLFGVPMVGANRLARPSCSASPRWSPSPARPASSGATRPTTTKRMRTRQSKKKPSAAGSRLAG